MEVKIGLQLYSVRNEIEERGLQSVLSMTARAGFTHVEFAGFWGHAPKEISAMLSGNGLSACSLHMGMHDAEFNLPYIDELGIKTAYIASIPFDELSDERRGETVRVLKEDMKILSAHGAGLGYHNHASEFIGGDDKIEKLLSEVDGLTSELDIFWAVAAGKSPVELMKKYGRVDCLHIKEMDSRTTDDPTEFPSPVVGDGKTGAREAMEYGLKNGIDKYILEVERFPIGAEEYLTLSQKAMRKFLGR